MADTPTPDERMASALRHADEEIFAAFADEMYLVPPPAEPGQNTDPRTKAWAADLAGTWLALSHPSTGPEEAASHQFARWDVFVEMARLRASEPPTGKQYRAFGVNADALDEWKRAACLTQFEARTYAISYSRNPKFRERFEELVNELRAEGNLPLQRIRATLLPPIDRTGLARLASDLRKRLHFRMVGPGGLDPGDGNRFQRAVFSLAGVAEKLGLSLPLPSQASTVSDMWNYLGLIETAADGECMSTAGETVAVVGKNTGPAGNDATQKTGADGTRDEDAEDLDLVTLDQAAAAVHRTKRAMENYLGKMPAPYVQGGGGKPSLWKWDVLRPWLESTFVPDLPKKYPGNRRSRN